MTVREAALFLLGIADAHHVQLSLFVWPVDEVSIGERIGWRTVAVFIIGPAPPNVPFFYRTNFRRCVSRPPPED